MPQLNPLDWAPQLIWLVITFGVLYLLMKRVALPKIGSVIEMRQGRIAGDLEAADKLRRETQEAIAAYEQALAEAKARAHGIAQEGRNRLKDEVAAENLAALRRAAPNLTEETILAGLVKSPVDIERANPHMWHGTIHGGDRSLPNDGPRRPVPGWAQHRMPIRGLYQASSATHGGGGDQASCA